MYKHSSTCGIISICDTVHLQWQRKLVPNQLKMDFRQAGRGGGDVVSCGFLLSNIFLFNSSYCLLFTPFLWLSEVCWRFGGCFVLRGGKARDYGKGPCMGGRDVFVWGSVCSAGQRACSRGGVCCGIIHIAIVLKGKLWTCCSKGLEKALWQRLLRKHTHAYAQIHCDNPGPALWPRHLLLLAHLWETLLHKNALR